MERVNKKDKYAVVSKNDYEKYKIPISLGNFLPKTKNKYIWSELEKRHPCFSDNYTFFSKEQLSLKGIISNVFVIEKNTLGKYKSRNNKIIIGGYKLPLTKNWEKGKSFIIISIFIILLTFFLFIIANKKSSVKPLVIEDNVEENQINVKYSDFDKKYLSKLLNSVKVNNGKVRNLSWRLVTSGEYISGTIDNLYPEVLEKEIQETSIKSIKYVDKNPFFDFSLRNDFVLTSELNDKRQLSIKNRENLRLLFKEVKIELLEEDINPYRIAFEIPIYDFEDKNKKSILQRIIENLEKNKIYVTGLNIRECKKNNKWQGIYLELQLTDNDIFKNRVLIDVNENIKLFYQEIKIAPVQLRDKTQSLINQSSNNKLLGEVKYRNGKKVLFFKTPEGKIVKKEMLFNEKV